MEKEKKIVFATNNAHKLDEIRKIAGGEWHILSLADINCFDDIPETGKTLEENAMQKAMFVKEHYGYDCFADDTGLMVEALGGEPGIYSARYAGENHDSNANIAKLLGKLDGVADRYAHFSTVICLIKDGDIRFFEGRVDGEILSERQGSGGFGYDPIFKPDGYEVTFSQLDIAEKNSISHRGRATAKLIEYLKTAN